MSVIVFFFFCLKNLQVSNWISKKYLVFLVKSCSHQRQLTSAPESSRLLYYCRTHRARRYKPCSVWLFLSISSLSCGWMRQKQKQLERRANWIKQTLLKIKLLFEPGFVLAGLWSLDFCYDVVWILLSLLLLLLFFVCLVLMFVLCTQ